MSGDTIITSTSNPTVGGTVTTRSPQGEYRQGTYLGNNTVSYP